MQPPQPLPAEQSGPNINVAPVPTEVRVSQVLTSTGQQILVQMITPVGLAAYFLDPDTAVNVGEALVQMGGAARSGLIIGNGHIPPPGPAA